MNAYAHLTLTHLLRKHQDSKSKSPDETMLLTDLPEAVSSSVTPVSCGQDDPLILFKILISLPVLLPCSDKPAIVCHCQTLALLCKLMNAGARNKKTKKKTTRWQTIWPETFQTAELSQWRLHMNST